MLEEEGILQWCCYTYIDSFTEDPNSAIKILAFKGTDSWKSVKIDLSFVKGGKTVQGAIEFA